MPVDMTKYPDDWEEIRNRILLRAGGDVDDPRVRAKCENCGVTNYELVYVDGNELRRLNEEFDECCPNESYAEAVAQKRFMEGEGEPVYSIVVLTIAHVNDPDPMNCDDDNLAAWCQRCHNSHDAPMRAKNAAKTRRKKIIKNGQLELL